MPTWLTIVIVSVAIVYMLYNKFKNKKLCDGLGISIVDFFNHSLFLELEQEVC